MSSERNNVTTYILPLLFQQYMVVSNTWGFINAYTSDINRPDLDKHVFLVYKVIPSVASHQRLIKTMKESPYYHSHYIYKIDGEHYEVFTFNIDYDEISADIQALMNGTPVIICYHNKMKIAKLWSIQINTHEHQILFDESYQYLPSKESFYVSIDEEDPPADLFFNLEKNNLETLY